MNLKHTHPALSEARTIHVKMVRNPSDMSKLLKPVSVNGKLGKGRKVIEKGAWKGLPMYALTLQERATCPTDCAQWSNCFGNNMRFAHRASHADPERLMSTIGAELQALSQKHPSGFVVRLHILGDFFSAAYAAFWRRMLAVHAGLHIYGYTHVDPSDLIGLEIAHMNDSRRCWIRWSDRGGPMSANVEGEGVPCPEQTGKTASCLTCGICWGTTHPVHFAGH